MSGMNTIEVTIQVKAGSDITTETFPSKMLEPLSIAVTTHGNKDVSGIEAKVAAKAILRDLCPLLIANKEIGFGYKGPLRVKMDFTQANDVINIDVSGYDEDTLHVKKNSVQGSNESVHRLLTTLSLSDDSIDETKKAITSISDDDPIVKELALSLIIAAKGFAEKTAFKAAAAMAEYAPDADSVQDVIKALEKATKLPVSEKAFLDVKKSYAYLGGESGYSRLLDIASRYSLALKDKMILEIFERNSTHRAPDIAAVYIVGEAVNKYGVENVINNPWLAFTACMRNGGYGYTAPYDVEVLREAFEAIGGGKDFYKGIEMVVPLHVIVSDALDGSNMSYVPLKHLAEAIGMDVPKTAALVNKDEELFLFRNKAGVDMVTTHAIRDDEDDIAHDVSTRLNEHPTLEDSDIDKAIDNTVKSGKVDLNDIQVSAIRKALSNRISLITGGPGTGKTTVIKSLVETAKRAGMSNIAITAPSSKAAANLRKAIGNDDFHATTVSDYVGQIMGEHGSTGYMNTYPGAHRDVDMVVIDEASMISHDVLAKVLRTSPNAHVVLVGDANQIGSIGVGNPFSDLIDMPGITGRVTTTLQKNYRQEGGSGIPGVAGVILGNSTFRPNMVIKPDAVNASGIHIKRSHEVIGVSTDDGETDTVMAALSDVLNAISLGKVTYEDESGKSVVLSLAETQIITPDKKKDGSSGKVPSKLVNVHEGIKTLYNPGRSSGANPFTFSVAGEAVELHTGDKIIANQNAKQYGILNGQMGTVLATEDNEVRSDGSKGDLGMRVDFDDHGTRVVTKDMAEASKITPAAAITVHKAQGSEFPCVIVAIGKDSSGSKNLLYTAITRARKVCFVIGDMETADQIARRRESKGNSSMTDSLQRYDSAGKGSVLSS